MHIKLSITVYHKIIKFNFIYENIRFIIAIATFITSFTINTIIKILIKKIKRKISNPIRLMNINS